MTILVAVKKNGKVHVGADRITTFGSEYATDLVGSCKIMKLKHGYLATSGYTLLDNVIEHLHENRKELLDCEFKTRGQVFQFFLSLYAELKDNYTLIDAGKDTYAGIYNVFLLVTPRSIFGVSNNLSVHEYERYAAKGAGSDYSQGALYALYDIMEDGYELTRVALEAACQFSIYCKEPIDIIEVKEEDFKVSRYGKHKPAKKDLSTHGSKIGLAKYSLVQKKELAANLSKKVASKSTTQRKRKTKKDGS